MHWAELQLHAIGTAFKKETKTRDFPARHRLGEQTARFPAMSLFGDAVLVSVYANAEALLICLAGAYAVYKHLSRKSDCLSGAGLSETPNSRLLCTCENPKRQFDISSTIVTVISVAEACV